MRKSNNNRAKRFCKILQNYTCKDFIQIHFRFKTKNKQFF